MRRAFAALVVLMFVALQFPASLYAGDEVCGTIYDAKWQPPGQSWWLHTTNVPQSPLVLDGTFENRRDPDGGSGVMTSHYDGEQFIHPSCGE